MPLSRLDQETKNKVPLIKKEFLRVNPKFKGMKLSENFLINRTFNYYLMNSPFQKEIGETEK